MKKLSAIFVALLLVAATAMTAFAAGINENEQKVLDAIKGSVKIKGVEMVWPDAYVNQAENYFNTIDMTSEQADKIIAVINEGKTYLEGTCNANIPDCTLEQKKALFEYLPRVMAPTGGSASHVKSEITLKDADGKEWLKVVPVLVEKSAAGDKDSDKKTDPGVVKTTGAGADFAAVAGIGAVLALIAVGGTLFVVKTKKA
jgi:hypothetical protein